MRRFACLAALAVAALQAGPARASTYTALYSFGDSLSDVGNIYVGTLGAQPVAPYFNGRFSNGPIWLDDVAAYYGLGPEVPSAAGGTDYAYGAARSGTNTIVPLSGNAALVPTVVDQVSQFLGGHANTAPSGALYTVWSGGNDIQAILASGTPNPAGAIGQAAQDEASAISALVSHGATNLLVVGNPNLGMTPPVVGTPLAGAATALTIQYSTDLLQDIAVITGASIRYLDLFSLIGQAASYGFSNATQPCFVPSNPVAPYGYPGTICSTVPAVQNTYLFFDSQHPTAAGHAVIAALAVPEPASWALLGLGLSAAALLRRRSASSTAA